MYFEFRSFCTTTFNTTALSLSSLHFIGSKVYKYTLNAGIVNRYMVTDINTLNVGS